MSQSFLPLNRIFLRPQFAIYYRRRRRFEWTLESISDYGALYLLAGELTVVVAGQDTQMPAGQSLLFNPGNQISASGSLVESVLVTFSPALIVDYAARSGLIGKGSAPAFNVAATGPDRRLSLLLGQISEELENEEAGQEIILSALIEQVAVQLLRRHAKLRRSDELELSRVGLIDRRIRRAVEFMQAHLDQELTLKEIAAASYLSPFHFARLFKKLTGAAPHGYLAGLRAVRARALLAETDLSVNEISSRVGYASASHFTKAFRQATGLTPRDFRAALVSRVPNG